MDKLRYPALDETLYTGKLPNGMPVFVFHRPEFVKTYAFFATDYGSIDLRFQLNGQWVDTPAGVAHFLEHKLFDMPDGNGGISTNTLQQLSRNGASPNAFTGYEMTAYLFDCVDKFEDNFKILLDFVMTPYFTEESVAKEQGIIGQEIRMYEDHPSWMVYCNLMESLYKSHPVSISIAGTVESIGEITHQTLYDCHKAMYAPCNMVLCVAGPQDPEHVMAIAREMLPKDPGSPAKRDYGDEDYTASVKNERNQVMAVGLPMFALGFKKDAPARGEARLRAELLDDLACETLAGPSSPLYARLYDKGLINRGFSVGMYTMKGASTFLFSGESKDPSAVRNAILEEAARVSKEGFDEALFSRLKKASFGQQLTHINSPESLCRLQASAYFTGADALAFPTRYEGSTAADAAAVVKNFLTPERMALSTITGK
jgi:predicted Zn-dependent peptidase